MADDGDRWVAVCTRDRLVEKTIVCATVGGVSVMLLRDGDVIHACERACPHEQADLSRGRVTEGRLHCPRHLAWFDLATGEISPGWSSRALRRYPVLVQDGTVWIDTGRLLPPQPRSD